MQETSREAYQYIRDSLGERQQLVFDGILKLGCPTNLELSKYLHIPINQVTPRTNELVKMFFVTECEKRICSISGRTAISWRIQK